MPNFKNSLLYKDYFSNDNAKEILREIDESFKWSGERIKFFMNIRQGDEVRHLNLFKFIKSNLKYIKDALKSGYYSNRDEGDEREFLDGDAKDWNFFEVTYLFVRFFSGVDNILRFDPHNIAYAFGGGVEDPLREVASVMKKINTTEKIFTKEKVQNKLYDWIYYQYEKSGEHAETICQFAQEFLSSAYRFLDSLFSNMSNSDYADIVVEDEGVVVVESEDVISNEYYEYKCANISEVHLWYNNRGEFDYTLASPKNIILGSFATSLVSDVE